VDVRVDGVDPARDPGLRGIGDHAPTPAVLVDISPGEADQLGGQMARAERRAPAKEDFSALPPS
jgi:hypothetical protein